MFEFIRAHQKIMQFLLLLMIAPAFAFVGLEGYDRANSKANSLAIVGDYEVTEEEFDLLKKQRIEELRAQSGDGFNAKLFESPEVNQQLLDSLVWKYLLKQSTQQQFLVVSDKALATDISSVPLFQVNGKFDLPTYKRELAARGLTPIQHQDNLRFSLVREQVLEPILSASFFSKTLKNQFNDVQLSARVVRAKNIDLASYLASVHLDDEKVRAYYEANKAQFMTPQKVNVEYVVLSPETIKSKVAVSESDIAMYYEQNKARFSTLEERRARHILLHAEKTGVSSSELKLNAEKVLADLQASHGQFSEFAKKYSIDTASANQGGDLGFLIKGATVPELDQAIFTQKKGVLSGLVKSQFGYHILEVTDIRGGQVQLLDEVREQVINEIKAQKITGLYADAQGRFSELVYEGAQSFDNVVKELGVKVETWNGLTQGANQGVDQVPEILKDPHVMAEIFSSASINQKNNIKAVQVGEAMVSARISSHTAATVRPFDEVKSTIDLRLRLEEAKKAALKDAQALVKKLDTEKPLANASSLTGFSESKTVSVLGSDGLSSQLIQAVLNTKASELPKAKVVELAGGGYVIAWIESIAPIDQVKAKADPQMIQYYEKMGEQTYQEALLMAARDSIKNRINVQINKKF